MNITLLLLIGGVVYAATRKSSQAPQVPIDEGGIIVPVDNNDPEVYIPPYVILNQHWNQRYENIARPVIQGGYIYDPALDWDFNLNQRKPDDYPGQGPAISNGQTMEYAGKQYFWNIDRWYENIVMQIQRPEDIDLPMPYFPDEPERTDYV